MRKGLAAVYFVALALVNALRINVDPSRHDQSMYLDQARLLAETHYAAMTNRVQMVVFSGVQSLFWSPKLDAGEWFLRAKLVSIAIALACAAATAALLARVLRPEAARFGAIVCAFYIYLPRAPYVQAEALYDFLSLAGILALVAFVRAPSLGRACLAGALSAIAWLTKASFLLPFEVFGLVFAARELALRSRRALYAAPLALAFVIVSLPYMRNSVACCGEATFNAPSRYVLFCDSWQDYLDRVAVLGTPDRWWQLSDARVPTLRHYLASHSLGQIAWRETYGLLLVAGNFLLTPFGPLAVIIAIACVVALRRNRELRARLFRWDARAPWPNVVAWLAASTLAFGFYGVIAANARFTISFAMPAFVLALSALSGRDATFDRAVRFATRVALAGLVVLPVLMATTYLGGS